ncbi:MAG: hypothetical protein AAF196_17705 [Planctomycetota bacterium]
MPSLVWFLSGAVLCALVARALHQRAMRRERQKSNRLAQTLRTELDIGRNAIENLGSGLTQVAESIGRDLGSISTGIESHVELISESLQSDPKAIARAGRLINTSRRLRLLGEKLVTFVGIDDLPRRPVDVRSALTSAARELDETCPHLSVSLSLSPRLPMVMGTEGAIRRAVVFLVETLCEVEPRTSRLQIRVGLDPQSQWDTRVAVELTAEIDDSTEPRVQAPGSVEGIGYLAARNLLEALGATLSFDAVEGISATCVISLASSSEPVVLPRPEEPASQSSAHDEVNRARSDRDDEATTHPGEVRAADFADESSTEAEGPTSTLEPQISGSPSPETSKPHAFGGVLVLENDPDIRELIAHELNQTGRTIVTCVDGAAARSLIQATPERFELAILEHQAHVECGTSIARLVHESSPGIRVILLGCDAATCLGDFSDANLACLPKPFGARELRAALEHAIAGA